MTLSEERFRRKVDHTADHDLWTGCLDERGRGLVRIAGKLRTVQRAAWEFAYGPLPPGARVIACSDERACVRLDHLRLESATTPAPPVPPRRTRRSGSKREVRPGTWELAVSLGPGPSGKPRRRFVTFHGSAADAEALLADLVESTKGPTTLGDMKVRELLDRYLDWTDEGDNPEVLEHDRQLSASFVEPYIGQHLAVLLKPPDVEAFLEDHLRAGAGTEELTEVLGLLRRAYNWAQANRWSRANPTSGIRLRDLVR